MRAESMPELVDGVNKVPIEVAARAASASVDVIGGREVGSAQIAVRHRASIESAISGCA
jgi:hypothetical protein